MNIKIFIILLSATLSYSLGWGAEELEMEKPGPVTVTDPHFAVEVYNWDLDYMMDESIFAVDLDSERATNYEVTIVARFPEPYFSVDEFDEHFNTPYTYSILYWALTPINNPNHFEFPAEWGEIYRFQGYNEAGYSAYTAPYLSTDYITDPEILARINELKNQALGVEDLLREPDPAADLVHRFGDSLKVSAEVSELAVFNEKGEKLKHVTDPQGEVSISDLESGIYFAAAKTSSGLSKTLKFRK